MYESSPNAPPTFEVTRRYAASKRKLLALLDDPSFETYDHTVSIAPKSLAEDRLPKADGGESHVVRSAVQEVVRKVGRPDTGVVLFVGEDRALAVVPPFPVDVDHVSQGTDASALTAVLDRRLVVGVVLLRLGRYAVGVVNGDKLVASKTGSRYVKNRHRAGGSSQHRFERSRERLVRELFDAACKIAGDVFGQVDGKLDYLLAGGERHTLDAFIKRCDLMQRHSTITLSRTLDVVRPGQAALERIHNEVWKSRVIELERVPT